MKTPQQAAVWPGLFNLTVENHGQWVHTDMPEADPDWRAVDSNGHGHFYAASGEQRYPTLTWIVEPCPYEDHDDCTLEGHYECLICGETVHPGTRTQQDFWVEGHTTYHLTASDGRGTTSEYDFGKRQWDELQEAIAELISDRLAPFRTSVTMGR